MAVTVTVQFSITLTVSVHLSMTVTVTEKFSMTLPVTVHLSMSVTIPVLFSLSVVVQFSLTLVVKFSLTALESTCNRTQRRMMVDRITLNMSCQIETCLILANKLALVFCTQLQGGNN